METETNRHRKPWTNEEDEILLEMIEKYTIESVSKRMGRTVYAIKNRLEILGIYSVRQLKGLLRLSEVAEMLGVSSHTIRNWIEQHEFPYIRKVYGFRRKKAKRKNADYSFDMDKVWKWAENYPHLLDFRKIPESTLYNAPDWIWELRKQRLKEVPLNHRKEWTKSEEDYLLFVIKGNKATLQSLSHHFKRDTVSVETKIRKLTKKHKLKVYIRQGKISLEKPNPWKKIEEQYQMDMKSLLTKWYWEDGLLLSEIAPLLGQATGSMTRLFKKYSVPVRDKPYPIRIGKSQHMIVGKIQENGRSYWRVPSHPYADSKNCVLESQVIVEQALGRYLQPHEFIVYRNGDSMDNSPENLEVREKINANKCEQTA